MAENLLSNSGFETPMLYVEPEGLCNVTLGGFDCRFRLPAGKRAGTASELVSGVWGGGSRCKSGASALRADLIDPTSRAHMSAAQDIRVLSGVDYDASVWVLTYSGGQDGFGANPGDSAGLKIEEYDSTGTFIAAHTSCLTDAASDYRQVQVSFRTSPQCVRVRFILDTTLSYTSRAGHVSYDDCVLSGPRPRVPRCYELADVRNLPERTYLRVKGIAVTAVFDGFFYVEDPGRHVRMRLQGHAYPGDVVTVDGSVGTVEGARVVYADTVTKTGTHRVPATVITGKSSIDTGGTHLIDLWTLVKTVGKVVSTHPNSDGSIDITSEDDTGSQIRVSHVTGKFAASTVVSVTGILDVEAKAPLIRATGVETVTGRDKTFVVTSAQPVDRPGSPAGLLRLEYRSGVDDADDWALLLPPASSSIWVVNLHGRGSHGDQLFVRDDIKTKWLSTFLGRGLGVLTPNLRDNGWMSPSAVVDLHDLLGYVRQHYGATRFVFVSASMGGTGNLIYAVAHPEDVAAIVSLCPATDLASYYSTWCRANNREISAAIRDAYGGEPLRQQERYLSHSALLNSSRITMPVYLAHGSADLTIPVDQARSLASALSKSEVFRYREIPDGNHDSTVIPCFDEGFEWVMSRISSTEANK